MIPANGQATTLFTQPEAASSSPQRAASAGPDDIETHHTRCLGPDQSASWQSPCQCGHLRVRHAPARHKPVPVDAGLCHGHNGAGGCLWPGCDCPTFTRAVAPVFRVLITGSRTWTAAERVHAALDELHARHGTALSIVHGACPKGADAIADAWATRRGVPVERYPADWSTGRAAGYRRNAAMVNTGPDLCVAFIHNHSRGATGCAALAETAAIPVIYHRHQEVTSIMDNPNALLRAALDAAERGWHVFPLRPGDKRPAFPNHTAETCTASAQHGRRVWSSRSCDPRCRAAGRHVGWEARATTDPDRIRRAWSAAPYNVGIACGPSGLVVVDLDVPKPGQQPPPGSDIDNVATGRDVFAQLCARVGKPVPNVTYTVTTGRGGTHLYFTHPANGPDLRNTEGCTGTGLGWLIDTRANGGYVVGAGSVVNSKPYTVAFEYPAEPLPHWLAERLTPTPLPAQVPVAVDLGGGRTGAYLRAAIDRQLAQITAAPVGGRNRALYLSAVALGQLAAGGAIGAEELTGLLTQAALLAGLRPAEITRTVHSGLRAGAARPRSVAA